MIYHPATHSELQCILDIIHQVLEEEEIYHVIEGDKDNPQLYFCGSYIDDYLNIGYIGWDEGRHAVVFVALNMEAITQAEHEGIPLDDDAKVYWMIPDFDTFMLHLRGDMRKLIATQRRIDLAALSESV